MSVGSQTICKETATDVIFSNVGETNPSTAATKTTDFVCVIKIKDSNIYTINQLDLVFGSATLHSVAPCADFNNPMGLTFDNLSIVNYEYRMRANYTGEIIPLNAYLLEYRFSTAGSYAAVVNGIHEPTRIAIKYGDVDNEYTDFAEKIVARLGDVNGDGTVSSADSMVVSQAISGSVTLSEIQAISADVNRNGHLDAQDVNMILQYSISSINSFWFDKTTPQAANSFVDPTKDYYLRNADTTDFLSISDYGDGVWGDYVTDSDSCLFNFIHIGNGLYKISWYNDPNLVLYLDYDKSLKFADISTTNRYKWYLVGNGPHFRIVNYLAQTEQITYHTNGNPGSGYNQYGMYWKLGEIQPKIPLDTYVDYAYVVRYGSNSIANAQQEISQLTGFVNQKLFDQFGFTLQETFRGRIASYGDQCLGVDLVSQTTIPLVCDDATICDDAILCPHVLQGLPEAYCTDSCTDRYHHNSPTKMLYYFREKQSNGTGYVSALFSGYNRCDDTSGGGSAAYMDTHDSLIMDFYSRYWVGQTETQMKQFVYLHEIGHCLGASGDNTCTAPDCIMSYSFNVELIKPIFTNNQMAFCTQCKNQILANVADLI